MTSHTVASKGNLINGEWKQPTGKPMVSIESATGQIIWTGTASTPLDVDKAVAAARKAFESWSKSSIEVRQAKMEAFKALLEQNTDLVAQAISRDNGKPLWEAKTEVAAMIGKVGISIDAYAQRCPLRTLPQPAGQSITRHRPHGVMAVIGPFNFPGHTPSGHIIPALLAGNTVVFKPSEQTPYASEVISEIWHKVGLPAGVLNMLQGGGDVGAMLSEHPDVNGTLFTGSYRVGKALSKFYGNHPERILALEMGGNNPLVIGDISDLNAAAYLTVQSAYITSGQRCTCARRLIIPQGALGDRFLETFIKLVSTIKVGRYSDTPEPFMGPVISEQAALRVIDVQDSFKNEGAKVLVEARLLKAGTGFVTPALIDVTSVKERADDETFGPLLQVIRVADFGAALQEANKTRYGLSAGLFSDSKEQYEKFVAHVHAGVVNWNTQTTGASSAAPFGGVGYSGNHRPSAYYAADYCAYPVASLENAALAIPKTVPPGITL